MSPKIVDREEKKKAIAMASVEVFSEKGFEKTRMEDVAKAAAVGKGTIYEYFQTKDELMEFAVASLFEDMAGDLMPSADAPVSATEILVSMIERSVESIKQVGFAYRFFLEYMIRVSRKDASNTFIGEMLIQYRHFLAGLLQQGMESGEFRKDLEPYETAAVIAAWIDGAVFHWYTLPNTVRLEAMGKRFIEMTLEGLRPRSNTKPND